MEICYFALKKLEVGDRHAEPGDLVPEAIHWSFLYAYVNNGSLGVLKTSTLFEDEQEALEEWERTGNFNLYDERNKNTMAERDMRLTSSVSEDERIDGSDEAVEGGSIPDPVVVDESSESTPYQVALAETEGDHESAEEAVAEEGDEEVEVEEVEEGYDAWTVADLKTEAINRNLEGLSKADKATLVKALEDDDARG